MLPVHSAHDEAVEDSSFLLAVPAGDERIRDPFAVAIVEFLGEGQPEVVDVAVFPASEVEFMGTFVENGRAEGREERKHFRESDSFLAVEGQSHRCIRGVLRTIEANRGAVTGFQRFEPGDVGDGVGGRMMFFVAGWERLRPPVRACH